jgi:hypothetical protein
MAGAQQGVTFALQNKHTVKQKRAPGGRATAQSSLRSRSELLLRLHLCKVPPCKGVTLRVVTVELLCGRMTLNVNRGESRVRPDKYRHVSPELVPLESTDDRHSTCRVVGGKIAILMAGGVMDDGQCVGRVREVIVWDCIKTRRSRFFETTGEDIRKRLSDNPRRGQALFNKILFQGVTPES